MPPFAEEHRSDDHAGEGGDPHRAEPAFRERLAEDGHPGDDRQRVRQERGDPGGGQGTAMLEARLEDERPERVRADQGGDEGEVAVGRLDRRLRQMSPAANRRPAATP